MARFPLASCTILAMLWAGCVLDEADKSRCYSDSDCLNGYYCSQEGFCIKRTAQCDCTGKCAGVDDGCGNTCAADDCPAGKACKNGVCCAEECPQAGSRECTDGTHFRTCGNYDGDGCLEWAESACDTGTQCVGGACPCTPKDCAQLGRECGTWSDGCGGSIECEACQQYPNSYCNAGQCECEPNCTSLCGGEPDGCGGICDPCPDGHWCDQGQCTVCNLDAHCGWSCVDCTQQATDRACIDDACGCRTDNECRQGELCRQGRCCAGNDCGSSTYICSTGCNWALETVDDGTCDPPLGYACWGGDKFGAAFDDQGRLSVAYEKGVMEYPVGRYEGDLLFSTRTSTGFSAGSVEHMVAPAQPPYYLGTAAVLAFQGDGTAHLGYKNPEGVRYARRAGASWEWIPPFDPEETDIVRILIDRQDRPYVVYSFYVNLFNNGVRTVRWNGNGWENVPTDDDDCVPFVLDANGLPHALCQGITSPTPLWYAHLSGTTWEKTLLWSGNLSSWDLAAGPDGAPQVTFLNSDSGGEDGTFRLMYARSSGLGFDVEEVPTVGNVACAALTVDPEGRAHVAFRDYSQKLLKYARRDADQWRIQTVDTTVYYDCHHQILISPAGLPTIVWLRDGAILAAVLTP